MLLEREEDQLLTIEELCDQLFISPTTAYKLLKSKEIRGFKLGSWHISKRSVQDYIKRKCN